MSAEAEHQELRSLLGAYLLGGLERADRDRLERHLAGCRGCSEELAALAPVPGLLGRLREPLEPGVPSRALLSRALREVRRERDRSRRRALAGWLAAGAAVAVAVVGGLALTDREDAPPGPQQTVVTLHSPDGGTTAGSVELLPKTWGTALTLHLEEMPSGGPFRVEVLGDDGTRQVGATWDATPTGRAVVSGASAVQTVDVRLVRVSGPDGTLLEGAP